MPQPNNPRADYQSLYDIRLLTCEGKSVSGADVYLYVTRRIWWAWPFYAIFSLPGFSRLIHVGYRWFARNRYCVSRACRFDATGKTIVEPRTSSKL
jgi:predicted DCC family thiol-disulfide oxidoreductase YuxK